MLSALLFAPLAASCAHDVAPAAEPATLPLASAVSPEPSLPGTADRHCALDLYEQARRAIRAGSFEEGLALLDEAKRLDPRSTAIRDFHAEIARVMNRRPGEWSTGGEWLGSGIAESLLRARAALAASMSRAALFVEGKRWSEAAAELDRAAGLARGIPGMVSQVGAGRLCVGWTDRGVEAMQRGEFGAGALCFEIALLDSEGLEPSRRLIHAEVLTRKLEECRSLATSAAPARIFRRPSFRTGGPPDPLRDRMSSALRTIVLARLLVGEREDARADAQLLASIAPVCQELSGSVASLPAWDPWEHVVAFCARRQAEFTTILGQMRDGHLAEFGRDFRSAAALFEMAEQALRGFPFAPDLEARQAEARSAAIRCRRLAEDASR